jgi:hypothetical protein
VPITVDEYHDFEEDVTRVSNAIRDNEIVVTSRGSVTALKLGDNPCGPFRGQNLDDEELEALYPLHTPGVNTGRQPAAGRSAAPDSHFSLRLQRHAAPAKTAPHDPASARAALMEQGIKSDYDLVVKRSSKSRVFMQNFDIENYPFGCAKESLNRLGEREMVYELLVAVYPKHMFEGVAHGDVVTAMAKTASTVHNDDPLRKNQLSLELSTLRLARGTPFEEGARVLWELVDDLEAMGVPVLGELKDFDLDKRKKEMLFTFINSNPDYEEVVKDYHRHINDYPGMYSHCVQVYSRLKPVATAHGNRSGNRRDGGDSHSGGRFQPARREYGRFADERPHQASSVQREKFRFDEEPRQDSNEIARRATKLESGQAQREGWDPTSRQKGFLTTRADAVATVQARRVLLLSAIRPVPLRRHGSQSRRSGLQVRAHRQARQDGDFRCVDHCAERFRVHALQGAGQALELQLQRRRKWWWWRPWRPRSKRSRAWCWRRKPRHRWKRTRRSWWRPAWRSRTWTWRRRAAREAGALRHLAGADRGASRALYSAQGYRRREGDARGQRMQQQHHEGRERLHSALLQGGPLLDRHCSRWRHDEDALLRHHPHLGWR